MLPWPSIASINDALLVQRARLARSPAVQVVTDTESGQRRLVLAAASASPGAVLLVEDSRFFVCSLFLSKDLDRPELVDFFSFGCPAGSAAATPAGVRAMLSHLPSPPRASDERLVDMWMEDFAARGLSLEEASRELCTFAPHAPGTALNTAELRARTERVVTYNAHPAAFSASGRSYGRGMWTVASAANHSCAPTARYDAHGRAFVLVAQQRMVRGDEVTIAYGKRFLYADTAAARSASIAAAGLGFTRCECVRCERERALGAPAFRHATEVGQSALRCRYLVLKALPELNPSEETAGTRLPEADPAHVLRSMRLAVAYLEQHSAVLCAEVRAAKQAGHLGLDTGSCVLGFCEVLLVPTEWGYFAGPEEERRLLRAHWWLLWRALQPLIAALEAAYGDSDSGTGADALAADFPSHAAACMLALAMAPKGTDMLEVMAHYPAKQGTLATVPAAQLVLLWNLHGGFGELFLARLAIIVNVIDNNWIK